MLPFYDGYWGGVWSGASYSSGTGLTTFTGNFGTPVGGGALGDSVKPGMVVVPDLQRAVPLHIESVSINLLGSDTLTVKGDATGLGGSGTRFRIHQHAPYKYDLTDELRRNTPCDMGSRYLWSSYRRIPWTWSRAGEDPYLAWNRVYLPEIGRWTSTDPLASPVTNLNSCGRNPLRTTDPSGLRESISDANDRTQQDLLKYGREMAKHEEGSRNYGIWQAKYNTTLETWGVLKNLLAQEKRLAELFSAACRANEEGVFEERIKDLDPDNEDANETLRKAGGVHCEKKKCCHKIAKAMAKSITEAMWERLEKSGQRQFGKAGNAVLEHVGGKQLFPLRCDCGKWANLVRDSFDSEFDPALRLGCLDQIPAVWDMFRGEGTDHPHNWTRFCWGTHCVDVDPWERGHADGSVAGGNTFDRASTRTGPNGPAEKKAEWATIHN